MFFVNGKQQEHIPVNDRSFQYGDGCFTTLLIRHGQPVNLAAHKQRLQETCTRLSIHCPAWEQIEDWLFDAIHHSEQANQAMSGAKIHISRGRGGRGYSDTGIKSSQVTIQTFDYPKHYPSWQSEGIKVGVSSVQIGINPLLAGLKHNNRLEQVLIKQDTEAQGYSDCIVLDCQSRVIEMCAANLFWVSGGEIHTPDLTNNGVAGVMRANIIEQASTLNYSVTIGEYHFDSVLAADEVFITNALHGIVPITQIETTTFTIGAVTRALQEKLNP